MNETNENNIITLEQPVPKPPEPFANVVGQAAAKKKLLHMIDNYRHSRYFKTSLFVAAKGQGKTTMAKETARNLCTFNEIGVPEVNALTGGPRCKSLLVINCADLPNSVDAFLNTMRNHVVDKDVTVLLDEASEIPRKITMAMLDIFNTDLVNTNYRTTYTHHDGITYDFDFKRETFLFCTSEPNKVFHALKQRFEEVGLEDYTHDELAKIVAKHMPGVQFEDGVLDEMATVVRGSAREAWHIAMNAREYLRGNDTFFKEDWEKLKDIYNILPLGLSAVEVNILRYLNGHAKTSLTSLSAKSGWSREALQKSCELHLQKHDLMLIETKGRVITAKGQQYLKALDANNRHASIPAS